MGVPAGLRWTPLGPKMGPLLGPNRRTKLGRTLPFEDPGADRFGTDSGPLQNGIRTLCQAQASK